MKGKKSNMCRHSIVGPPGKNAPCAACLYVFVYKISNLSQAEVFFISCHEPVTATSLVENECRQP